MLLGSIPGGAIYFSSLSRNYTHKGIFRTSICYMQWSTNHMIRGPNHRFVFFVSFQIRFVIRIRLFAELRFDSDSDSVFFEIMIRIRFFIKSWFDSDSDSFFWNHDSDSDSDSVKNRIISNYRRLLIDLNLLEIWFFLIRFYSKCSVIF